MISIEENIVNVKYGFNGTGKSTIAKALQLHYEGQPLDNLKPFKANLEEISSIQITPETPYKVAIFNEDYINSYAFNKFI